MKEERPWRLVHNVHASRLEADGVRWSADHERRPQAPRRIDDHAAKHAAVNHVHKQCPQQLEAAAHGVRWSADHERWGHAPRRIDGHAANYAANHAANQVGSQCPQRL